MPIFIVKTNFKDVVVEAANRSAAAGKVEGFISVDEFDPETQKLCPGRDECGCDVMPASHNFCHKCGKELVNE